MSQTLLHFEPPEATHCDRTGFRLGWDHARHGLVPPPGLLLDGTPVSQGWRAGRAVFGRRTLPVRPVVRRWLELRTDAWCGGVHFDDHAVTPNFLAQIDTLCCPITRQPLGGAGGSAAASVVERIDADVGYAAGNLVVLGAAAAQARQGTGLLAAVRQARRCESGEAEPRPLDATAWWRLATLQAFATPMPFHQAVRLPLALLPPNRVRVLNAAQGLQMLLTLQFTLPRWSRRTGAIAAALPQHTLRTDFNLLVGAIAPRVLDALATGRDLREALEDAWLTERVQRRWQHFALSLGENGVEVLLARLAEAPLPGCTARLQAPSPAREGCSFAPHAGLLHETPGATPAVPHHGPRGTGRRPLPPVPRSAQAPSARRSSPPPVPSAGAPGR